MNVFSIPAALFSLLIILPHTAWGVSDAIGFNGYMKSWAIRHNSLPFDGIPPFPNDSVSESQNAIRLMFNYFPKHRLESGFPAVSLQLHYEVQPFFSSHQPLFGATDSITAGSLFSGITPTQNRYRISNPNTTLIRNGPKSGVYHNLDRLNMQLNFTNSDLTIGRQAIALGVARSINPSDIFVPNNVTTLNQEYRQGIDAIRYQYTLGPFTELDTGFIFGHHMRDNAAWTQLLFPVNRMDLSVILARANDDWLVGGGLQGSVGLSGVWFEAAQLRGHSATYTRYTVGIDRSLTGAIFIQIESHYSGAGETSPVNYTALLNTRPWQDHGVFLLGKRYLIPAINWQISPLLSQNTQILYNLDDHSWLFSAQVEFNIAENFYIDGGATLNFGKALGQNGKQEAFLLVTPHSEFGSSPARVYSSLRYYF